MQNKIVEVQYLRGLAVALVIIGHAHQAEGNFFSEQVLGEWAFAGFAGVDLFFVISGFIIHSLYGASPIEPVHFLLNRANRILPLYWAVTALAMLGSLVLLGNEVASVVERLDVGTLLLWPTNQLPFLAVGWTLTHELYFYLAYILFLAVPAQLRWWLAGGWALVGFFLEWLSASPGDPLARLLLSPFNFLFFSGVFLAECRELMMRTSMRPVLLGLVVSGAALAIFWTGGFGIEGINLPGQRVLVFAPLVIGLFALVMNVRLRLPEWTERIGDWSYSAYLIHSLVIVSVALVLARFIDGFILDSLMFYALAFLGSFVAAGILHHLLEKPALRWGKLLISKVRKRDT